MKALLATFALLLVISVARCENDEQTSTIINAITDKPPLYGAYPPNSTVCYDELGCFSNMPPFDNTGFFLPVEPNKIQTEFLLFTRQNPNEEQFITYQDLDGIKNSVYNPNVPLKIIIHGFQNNRTSVWIAPLKDALLAKDDFNVIVVDWGLGAVFPLYNNASSNTRLVGRQVCLLVRSIAKVFYASDPKAHRVHCIGHSLGAHTCGYASNYCDSGFDRVSALDPAGPLFEDIDPIARVDSSDAKYVDVIHSNAGTILNAAAGMTNPVGHIDFYPNGGKSQPGCPNVGALIGGFIGIGGINPAESVSCSHNRAIYLYIESLGNHCGFTAFPCTSQANFDSGKCLECDRLGCPQLGYYAYEYKNRGTFYLSTNEEAPFCGPHHFIELFVSGNIDKTAGDLTMYLHLKDEKIAKVITTKDRDINANDVLSKVLVIQQDLYNVESIEFYYEKRPKTWFSKDVSPYLYFDKLRITNTEINEVYSYCGPRTVIEDKHSILVTLSEGNC